MRRPAGAPPRLLVTGFGPFPGISDNPAAALVERIAAQRLPGVATRVLATEWTVGDGLADAVRGADAVLMFGVAATARHIRYERRAQRDASPAPDAAGQLPGAPPLRQRYSALDVVRLAAQARRAGFPVHASADAGRYVCNAAYNAALAISPRVLFVHVPAPTRRGALSLDGLERHALWLTGRLRSTR